MGAKYSMPCICLSRILYIWGELFNTLVVSLTNPRHTEKPEMETGNGNWKWKHNLLAAIVLAKFMGCLLFVPAHPRALPI